SQEGDAKILYPAAHASLYQQIGLALSELNAKLERVEQIVRFAVLSGPFATEAYRVVGPGKIRRDRVAVRKIYADVISYLFGSAPNLDASFVPGIERRLRPTERPWGSWKEGKATETDPPDQEFLRPVMLKTDPGYAKPFNVNSPTGSA